MNREWPKWMAMACLATTLGWVVAPFEAQELEVLQTVRGPSLQPEALVVAADGRHAYAAAFPETQLWARSLADGQLSFVRSYLDPSPPEGNSQAFSQLALSADGRFLYVRHAADSGAVLSVYSRSLESGELSLGQRLLIDDETPRTGAFLLSPDDRHLYVGGDDLVHYRLDSASGELTEIGRTVGEETRALVFLADGRTLAQGTAVNATIRFFERDLETGGLVESSSVELVPTGGTVQTLLPAATGVEGLYAETTSPGFISLSQSLNLVTFENGTPVLTARRRIATGLTDSTHGMAMDPESGGVIVARFDENGFTYSLVLYRPVNGGSDFESQAFLQGGNPQFLNPPRAVALSSDRRQVYAAGFAGQLLTTVPMTLDPRAFDPPLPAPRVEYPRLIFRSSLGDVSVATETGLLQARETVNGLEVLQWQRHPGENRWEGLAASPSGRFLYAGSRSSFSGGYIFEKGDDGLYAIVDGDGEFSGPLAISPSGELLAYHSGTLRIARLDPTTGNLVEQLESGVEVRDATDLYFLPGGDRLLATGLGFDGPVGRYVSVDPSTLAVSELPVGDPALLEAMALGVSPDGRFVYSIWEAEPDDFRLATLERTGDVLQTIFLDALNIAGMRPKLDIDPEGRVLYVYHGADELSRWLLDQGSGRPERLETLRQGV
ncbi:MAG: beta-propeller fold lactonase family protein, partial [Acidobacteriota bacterium]